MRIALSCISRPSPVKRPYRNVGISRYLQVILGTYTPDACRIGMSRCTLIVTLDRYVQWGMRILQLDRYRDRNPNGYFHDLPLDVRISATHWLNRFCRKWAGNLPPWRFAILVAQAKRLALNPPTSSWGRPMLAKRGGLALQRKLRLEGKHPTAHATRCRVLQQNARKRALAEAQMRARLGLPTPARVKYLSLD
jgi:hypothetical protein